jgi:uncharacterized membrane protein YfcA
MFEVLVALASLAGGAIASISGFGIGSIITPLLVQRLGTKVAVAAVSIPHVIGTALRFFLLRKSIDRRVLLTFGVASAAGGLLGAVLHVWVAGRLLTILLGALLILSGTLGLFGITLQFRRRTAYAAGILSGVLGGLVGNQGGIRAGAMMGFGVSKEAFVATSTLVGLIVDGARVPVYLITQGSELLRVWPLIAIASIAVVIGTIAGRQLLSGLDEAMFRRVVSALIAALGIWLLVDAI